MDIRYYFSIFFRRIKEIAAIAIVFSLITTLFSVFLVPQSFTSTVVATIASQRPENIDYRDQTINETLKGADTMSETVQGWTKSPGFYNKLEDASGETGFSVTVRTQEKQNLLAEIKADSETLAQKVSDTFITVLNDELKEYNKEANNSFVIAWSSSSISEDSKDIKVLLVVSLIVGLVLAILAFYLYEYLFGICSFRNQPEKILGVKSVDTLKKSYKKKDLKYLKAYLKNLDKDYRLGGVGFKIKDFDDKIEDVLDREYKKNLLSKAEILGKTDINLVVFVKLGSTKIEDLKKLIAVYKGDISLVLVN